MDDAARVVLVDDRPVFRIQSVKLFHKVRKAFILKPLFHPQACLFINRRNVIDAFAYCVDIHHAATGQEKG